MCDGQPKCVFVCVCVCVCLTMCVCVEMAPTPVPYTNKSFPVAALCPVWRGHGHLPAGQLQHRGGAARTTGHTLGICLPGPAW